MTQSNVNSSAELNLETLQIGQLRKLAKEVYNVELSRNHSKDDIIALIEAKKKRKAYAALAPTNSDIPPGRARIRVHNDRNEEGSRNAPVFVSVNGVACYIPRNTVVDVAIKFYENLRNACYEHEVRDPDAPEGKPRFIKVEEPRYAMDFYGMTPGPDPLPGDEVSRGAAVLPYQLYAKKYKRWPNAARLEQWLSTPEYTKMMEEWERENQYDAGYSEDVSATS